MAKEPTRPTPTLTATRAVELLERLARDDEFRARMEREPRKALREYGVELPRNRPRAVSLPEKETIEAALRTLPREPGRRLRMTDVWPLTFWFVDRR